MVRDTAMNIEQAKQIDLCAILDNMGCVCAEKKEHNAWYYSPFRQENTASLHVMRDRNRWFDFSEGRGGDIIDLVKHCYKCRSTPETLYQISALLGKEANHLIMPRKQKVTFSSEQSERKTRLITTDDLSIKLLRYSRSRGITDATVCRLCRQVNFQSSTGKLLYAIGFENDQHGWELRNPFYKGSLGAKDITSQIDIADKPVIVFEGFFDYMSAIELNWLDPMNSNTVILNSTAMVEKAINLLLSREVILCLDNDAAGKNAGGKIRQSCNVVEDWSNRFKTFNDLNEYLVMK